MGQSGGRILEMPCHTPSAGPKNTVGRTESRTTSTAARRRCRRVLRTAALMPAFAASISRPATATRLDGGIKCVSVSVVHSLLPSPQNAGEGERNDIDRAHFPWRPFLAFCMAFSFLLGDEKLYGYSYQASNAMHRRAFLVISRIRRRRTYSSVARRGT